MWRRPGGLKLATRLTNLICWFYAGQLSLWQATLSGQKVLKIYVGQHNSHPCPALLVPPANTVGYSDWLPVVVKQVIMCAFQRCKVRVILSLTSAQSKTIYTQQVQLCPVWARSVAGTAPWLVWVSLFSLFRVAYPDSSVTVESNCGCAPW